jgi:UDP-GlcNAc:undecaprenyl-phosphate/decaprenyl-phosphate GlcNAc-1-phosphate transferase
LFLNAMALLLGFAFCLVLTPLVIRVAGRYSLLDFPSDDRHSHSFPVPRLGGVAVFFSTACAAAALLIWDGIYGGGQLPIPLGPLLPGVIIGAIIVFLTGLFDDLKGVSPVVKLMAQTVAALAVVAYGFSFHSWSLAPGSAVFHFGWAGAPLTVLWIVGITNAFNLIDGVDGLAGSFALIGLATCVAADFLSNGQAVLTVTLALAGAIFAFLRFNSHPARIFLGDSGSMTIGFFLAVRSVVSATKPDGNIYLLIPLFALAFPITDTFIAIARRWIRGQPISRADGRHVHHKLLALGLSPVRTCELLGVVFAGFATIGLSVIFAPPRFTLALLVGAGILGFSFLVYGIRFLQYNEFLEFGRSAASVVRSARGVVKAKVLAEELAQQIENAMSLGEIEFLLKKHSERTGVIQIELLAGQPRFMGPEGQMIAPPDALPWRLDYRMGIGDAERREMLLRIWCASPPPGASHGSAERFAMRIGPAIERWIQTHPASFAIQTEKPSGTNARAKHSDSDLTRQ